MNTHLTAARRPKLSIPTSWAVAQPAGIRQENPRIHEIRFSTQPTDVFIEVEGRLYQSTHVMLLGKTGLLVSVSNPDNNSEYYLFKYDKKNARWAISSHTLSPQLLTENFLAKWKEVGELISYDDLKEGETPYLIISNNTGDVLQEIPVEIQTARRGRDTWPIDFANGINTQTKITTIGEINPQSGRLEAIGSAYRNKLYLQKDSDLNIKVVIKSDGIDNRLPTTLIVKRPEGNLEESSDHSVTFAGTPGTFIRFHAHFYASTPVAGGQKVNDPASGDYYLVYRDAKWILISTPFDDLRQIVKKTPTEITAVLNEKIGHTPSPLLDPTSARVLTSTQQRFELLATQTGAREEGLFTRVAQIINATQLTTTVRNGDPLVTTYALLRDIDQHMTQAFALFKQENHLPTQFLSRAKYLRQRLNWYNKSSPFISIINQAKALLTARPEINLPGITLPDTQAYTTTYIDQKGDFSILNDRLRQLQTSAEQTISSNQIFIPIDVDSPTANYVYHIADVLTYLILSLKAEGDNPDIEGMGLASISNNNMKNLLMIERYKFTKINFQQAFHAALIVKENNTYSVVLTSTSANHQPVTVMLDDRDVRYLNGYATKLQSISLSSPFQSLVIRDDATVTLASLLQYYGIHLADKATQADITSAISDLRPKAALIIGAADKNPAGQSSSMVIDTTNLTATTCTFNEHETSDYDTLTREIKKMCDSAYNDYQQLLVANTHFGLSVSQGEAELLRSMQNQGGIALKLSLEDTDGENNTYHEQHIANPKGAKTLKNYLDNTAEALGNYMINKIRDKDGENEGAINIKSMTLTFFFPRFVETKLDLAERYIHAVNIRAKTPPFLYLDPASSEANTIIQKAFSDITYELKVANGDVSQSKKFLQAVNRLLEKETVSLKEMSETQRKTKISAVSDELLQVYYRISAKNIEKHQRLLIAQQPYQTEFIGRALCRQLDIDEFHWPIITGKPLRISYETGLENVGNFIRGDRLTSKTLLEIVYDQTLRKEVGLATNKNDVLTALASTLKQACQLPVDELALKEKIAELFDVTYLVIATSANNGNLSDELNHPQETFIRNNDKYIEQAAKDYRRLEAEKIALSSNDILSLMNQVIRLREAGQPIDFETLLNNNQKILLNPRTEKFKDFLKVQRNSDDFSDLVPAWQQIALQLKDFALQVCRNAPLEICMAVNLVDDIVEGADAETLGMDGLCYAASVLSGFKNLSLQRLGALAQQGGNAWSLVQSIEAYKQAIKDKNYQAANQCLVGIFMSAHGLLASGAAIVESLHEHVTERMSRALTDEKMEENKPINANEDHVAERDDRLVEKPATTAHEMNGHDQYWTFNDNGQLFEKTIGRAVVSSLWNGDVIVKGGARAIALGDGTETVYMLGNTAHQAARTPEGNLELWPIHDMNLREGRWSKVSAANPEEVSFVHSSEASAAFPDNFSGLSTRSETSSLNTVTWYDNHMSTFDTITAEKRDAGGISSGTESIHIGVIEHKYVIEHHGSIEILDHHGTTNGKTTLIRNDGSSFTIDRELLKKPTYKPEIQAKIVGAKGMFVTVEISEAVNGLVNKKTVGGVLATTKTGGQELVVQLDEGVHYRGTVAEADRLALTPGETSVDQEPIHLDMQKISSEADPKRASPELWRTHPAYKESIAHDDFALELFYGAKAANEAYTKNLKWLQENTRVIKMIKDELPPEMRDVFNPYYLLSTSEENAILFAARNRVKLASTLLGKTTTRWGELSHPPDITFVESLLKKIRHQSPLLSENEMIPSDPEQRADFHHKIKEKLDNNNLLLAEVVQRDGKSVYFASPITEKSGLTVDSGNDEIKVGSSGRIVDHIEATYPDPAQVEKIKIFSLDPTSEANVQRIFVSSQRGYQYESITSLETSRSSPESISVDPLVHIPDGEYAQRVRQIQIDCVTIDLNQATYVSSGAKTGAYQINNSYYVELDNGKIYRAQWESSYSIFRLMQPEGEGFGPAKATPLLWYIGGRKFTLINRPCRGGGKRELLTNITLDKANKVNCDGKEIYIRTEPMDSARFGENTYAVYNASENNSPLEFQGTYVVRTNEGNYEVAPLSNVQNRLTHDYWKAVLEKKSPTTYQKTQQPDFWKTYAVGVENSAPRTLVDITLKTGSELLSTLETEESMTPEQMKLYRGMDHAEAEAIQNWNQEEKAKTEALIKNKGVENGNTLTAKELSVRLKDADKTAILPIRGHLGDLAQAQAYGTGAGKVIMEITLKPGAHNVLFDPKYMAITRSGVTTAIIAEHAKFNHQGIFPKGSGSEGNLPGYIGLKSEAKGPFSFTMGESYPTHLLFQLFISDVRIMPAKSSHSRFEKRSIG